MTFWLIAYILGATVSTVIWLVALSIGGEDAPSPQAVVTFAFFWPYFTAFGMLRGLIKGWRELHQ